MKTCLVLEGGAMRGIFTCGVLDTMMKNNIDIDCIVGVSAGALFGVNYFSNQPGRAIRYTKKYCGDKRFISKYSLLKTGNAVNKDFTFYKITKELDPLDEETFEKANKDYHVVVTNVETGKTEYINVKKPIEELEVFRATSALPFASELIRLGDYYYMDGAITDSIPIEYAKSLGYEKIIVVLTQPIEYKKTKMGSKRLKLIELKYSKYDKFIDALKNRHTMYNKQLEYIKELEDKNEIFVIRPTVKINTDPFEKDKNKIQDIYDLGVKNIENHINELKEYLNE